MDVSNWNSIIYINKNDSERRRYVSLRYFLILYINIVIIVIIGRLNLFLQKIYHWQLAYRHYLEIISDILVIVLY